MVLSPEDFAKYKEQVMPAKSDRASSEQELANKVREQTKLENQMKHCRGVIEDLEGKLIKHRILLSDLVEQHREISEKITALSLFQQSSLSLLLYRKLLMPWMCLMLKWVHLKFKKFKMMGLASGSRSLRERERRKMC